MSLVAVYIDALAISRRVGLQSGILTGGSNADVMCARLMSIHC